MRLHDDAARPVTRDAERDGLRQLSRRQRQRRDESCHPRERRLFDDRDDARTVTTRGIGGGEQQRPAARHDDALATHRHAAFDERLQAACTGHAGQGPAVERKQPLARAGREDELRIREHERRAVAFEQQPFVAGRCRDLRRVHHDQLRVRARFVEPLAQWRGGRLRRTLPPDLAASARIVVDERDAPARSRRHSRRAQARRSRADDRDVHSFDVHRVVSIDRPSRQSV